MRSFFLLTAMLIALGIPANAATVYSYQGNNFNLFSSFPTGYTTADAVSGYFTLDTPLSANVSGIWIVPSAFSFSDGTQTITSSQFTFEHFSVSTDSQGNIDNWNIQVEDKYPVEIDTEYIPFVLIDAGHNSATAYGAVENKAGVWTTTNSIAITPEPSSFALLLTGFAGMSGILRKRLS